MKEAKLKACKLIEALERFAPSNPFIEHNLFEPPSGWNVVKIYREQMIDFRNNYRIIAEFAAWVCDVPFDKFCKMDMITFIDRRANEVKE